MKKLVTVMTEVYDPVTDFMEHKKLNEVIKASINKLRPKRQIVFRLIKIEHNIYEYAAKKIGCFCGKNKRPYS